MRGPVSRHIRQQRTRLGVSLLVALLVHAVVVLAFHRVWVRQVVPKLQAMAFVLVHVGPGKTHAARAGRLRTWRDPGASWGAG